MLELTPFFYNYICTVNNYSSVLGSLLVANGLGLWLSKLYSFESKTNLVDHSYLLYNK